MPSSLACVHEAHTDCSLKGCACHCHRALSATRIRAAQATLAALDAHRRVLRESMGRTSQTIAHAQEMLSEYARLNE